jgi:hypothetical protein
MVDRKWAKAMIISRYNFLKLAPILFYTSFCITQLPAQNPKQSETQSSTPAEPNKAINSSEESPAALSPQSSDVSLELMPYRIDLRFSVADEVAIDESQGRYLLAQFADLAGRIVGKPWSLNTQWSEGQVWDSNFNQWTQWPEQVSYDRKTLFPQDKIWLIRAQKGLDSNTIELIGREFDTRTGNFGPARSQNVPTSDLPRGIFELTRLIFRPVAEVAANEGGKVRLRLQASALPAAMPEGAVIRPDQYFQMIRIFFERSGKFAATTTEPWTYLKVDSISETGVLCQIISSFRDPIGRKYRQANKLYALAQNPAAVSTPLQFSQLVSTNGTPVRHPIAGYQVEIHRWPDGEIVSSQLTDRDGRVTITPPPGLDFFGVRLLGGPVEPLLDVPILAGDQVPPVLSDTKPAAVEFEQSLISFRDEILDAIAKRLVFEARLGERTRAEDWESVAQLIRSWQNTSAPVLFENRLSDAKISAQKRQITEKKAIMTQAAQALVAELEALVSRYDSQDIEIFEESLQKRSSTPYLQDLAEKKKENDKAKPN